MEKINDTCTVLRKLFAEMILDESLKQYRKDKLYREIDRALDCRDEEGFYTLTDELNAL